MFPFWKKPKIVQGENVTLGEVLLRLRKVTPEQLTFAVEQQRDHLLGEVLVSMGVITPQEVATALGIQAQLKAGDRAEAELSLLEETLAEAERCSQAVDREIVRTRERLTHEQFACLASAKAS